MDIAGFVFSASTWVIPVLIAITFHEAAHAFAAWRFGDDTAYRMGRMTFNPLKHVDPFGTVILPALLVVLQAPFLFGTCAVLSPPIADFCKRDGYDSVDEFERFVTGKSGSTGFRGFGGSNFLIIVAGGSNNNYFSMGGLQATRSVRIDKWR